MKVKLNSSELHFNLDESEHKEFNLSSDDYICIEASQPVLVIRYLQSLRRVGNIRVDTYMSIVPPLEQYPGHYVFSTVDTPGEQYVNVVIKSTNKDGLLLDQQPLNVTQGWKDIRSFQLSYSALQVPVDSGLHNVSHVTSESFSAIAYSHPLGMRLDTIYDSEQQVLYETTNTGLEGAAGGGGGGGEKEIHTNYQDVFIPQGPGISSTVIAIIVSLCVAVFMVIVCILGFIVAELFGRREEFRNAKIMPFVS